MARPGPEQDGRVCIGVVVGAHGVRGALKIKSFATDPGGLTDYGPLTDDCGRAYQLAILSRHNDMIVAHVAGIDDRNAAEAVKGKRLYVPRGALPAPDQDEFYVSDLVGLRVEAEDGRLLGRVRAVENYGAGDLLDLALADGRTVLVQFSREVVPIVDVAAGRLVLIPPAGLIEEAGE